MAGQQASDYGFSHSGIYAADDDGFVHRVGFNSYSFIYVPPSVVQEPPYHTIFQNQWDRKMKNPMPDLTFFFDET
jgi:hypothetical protein